MTPSDRIMFGVLTSLVTHLDLANPEIFEKRVAEAHTLLQEDKEEAGCYRHSRILYNEGVF